MNGWMAGRMIRCIRGLERAEVKVECVGWGGWAESEVRVSRKARNTWWLDRDRERERLNYLSSVALMSSTFY